MLVRPHASSIKITERISTKFSVGIQTKIATIN
jgi:hypothetical protein